MSAGRLGWAFRWRSMTDEQRAAEVERLRTMNVGRAPSPETIRKSVEVHSGRARPEGVREKISAAQRGKPKPAAAVAASVAGRAAARARRKAEADGTPSPHSRTLEGQS